MPGSSALMGVLKKSVHSEAYADGIESAFGCVDSSLEYYLLTFELATYFNVQEYEPDQRDVVNNKLTELLDKINKYIQYHDHDLQAILDRLFVLACKYYCIQSGYSLTEEILDELNAINLNFN